MPAISPDGKHMVCSMSDYGYFTIFHKQSDLYSIELETGAYKKLELNTESAESFSSWSSNGRWLVFSSKRMDDVFSRPHIAYMDADGVAHQLPKIITGKIELTPEAIRDIVVGE
jgi:Tol biopolymer transport system component